MNDNERDNELLIPLGEAGGVPPSTIHWDPARADPPVLVFTGREGSGTSTWLARIVADALPGIPTLLVADRPDVYPLGQPGLDVWAGGGLDGLLASAGSHRVVVCDTDDRALAAQLAGHAHTGRFCLVVAWRAEGAAQQVFPDLDAHTVVNVSDIAPTRAIRVRDLDGGPMVPLRRPGTQR